MKFKEVNGMGKVGVAIIAVAMICCASPSFGGIWSKLGLERAVAKAGARGAASAAVRGSVALERVAMGRAASKGGSVAAAKEVAETIAKAATPRKILAVGGAVAAVTASHELSDGGQTVLEETAKTIRENPDKADSLLGKLTEPINRIAFLVGVVLIGILCWFVSPWISLVRNIAKWRALKKSINQRKKEEENNVRQECGIEMKARSGKIRYGMVLGLAAFGLLIMTAVAAFYPDDAKYLPKSVRNNPEYIAELRALYDNFLLDVQQLSESNFGGVRRDVPKIASEFGKISTCIKLVWNLAVDKLKGGNRTEACVQSKLEESYYARLYSSRDDMLGLVTKLRSDAKAIALKYAGNESGAIERVDEHAEKLYHEVLVEIAEDVEDKKQNLKCGQISMGISVAIELICVRQTVSTVSKIFGRAVARTSVSAATGGCLALVDGPLPIGDIVGGVLVLGSTAWTAWDIYQGTKVLPRELEGSLYEGVDKCEKYSVEESLAAGDRIFAAYGLNAQSL